MKKLLRILLAMAVMMCAIGACSGKKNIRMGTGNIAGNYYSYGNVIRELVEKKEAGFSVEVRETAGSAANLRLMQEGFLDMAIVQSDVLSDAIAGKGSFEGRAYSNVRVVAGLYIEQCQIVVAKESEIRKVEDLKGKRVSIGEKESGVAVVAREIFQAVGMREDAMTVSNLSFSESAAALSKGEIDAFFVMAGAPTTVITELCKEKDIRILPLDERTIEYMTGLYDGYAKAVVPAGTYSGQDEEIATIGVKAVLVADASVAKDRVQTILEVLFSDSADFKYGASSMKAPEMGFATKDLPGHFHDGAAKYYESKSLSVITDSTTGKKQYVFGGQDQ